MTSYLTRLALLVVAPLTLASCDLSDLLSAETPDLINPDDVRSPAGANAVRLGAIARFVQATTGAEGLPLLGGMMADEFINGDTFIERHEVDRRQINEGNSFLTTAARNLHRARLSAEQAIDLMNTWIPTAPGWQVAEMYFMQAYLVNLAAEHYCDGLVFSTVEDGVEIYGSPITTAAAYAMALDLADDGIALITGATADDDRILNALRVTRGRILMNLNQPANAALAVAAVPTAFEYRNLHSLTTFENAVWTFNSLARRYSVSDGEGGNGLDFATAGDERVPVCQAPCAGVTQSVRDDASGPLYLQQIWTRESAVTIVDGIAARMIEAEALQAAADASWLTVLNDARATGVALADLVDPGNDPARIDMIFRERAFWQFGRGTRFGELRRLVRQYGRPETAVFPTGAWHKAGGTYGTDVTVPVPAAEANNPNVGTTTVCINRDA
jgi:hypothetical protein